MKEVPEWRIEPQVSPIIYFDKDVYYLGVLYPKMKVKWNKDAFGHTAYVKNPNDKVIWEAEITRWMLKFQEFWVDASYPLGRYTAVLKKDGVVVASDTAVLRKTPKCEANESFCLFGDLWRCIDGDMQEYEKNSSYCIRNGFRNISRTVPDTLRLPEGYTDMMFTKKGYEDKVIRGVSIKKGKTTPLVVILSKKPQGYLKCETTPKGARVWNRQPPGELEFPAGFEDMFEETPATIGFNLGKYDIAFTYIGYIPKIVKDVIIKEGETKIITVTLEKEGAPPSPTKSYINCSTNPSGANIWIKKK
jgi:hypothetical protein